jgi:hypothetical protein
LACHSARPSYTDSPARWTAKSTIVVTPPHAAAIVPVSNVSDANGAAERQLHVGVGVDAARDDVLAGGVDDPVGGDAERLGLAGREDRDDRLAVDQDVTGLASGRRHDGPVGEQRGAHGFPFLSPISVFVPGTN